jgi:hypothetical protein
MTSRDRIGDCSRIVVPMNWFQSSKDLIAIAIAALAVLVSLVTVIFQRRQEQRAAYREIYTTLMSEDLHQGRWLINNISKTHIIPEDEVELRLIYRTLGVFDNMAMFTRRRVVPLKWVLEVWHHPLKDMRKGTDIIRQNFIEVKYSSAATPWPQLWILLDKAQRYHSTLPCCPPDNSWRGRIRRLAAPNRWRWPRTRSSTARSPSG